MAVRILYVDDDVGLGVLLAKSLAPYGYDVEAVETGEAALQRLETDRYGVVALDHNLTSEVGLDLIPRIRSLPSPPPIIYVTGSDEARVAVAALKAGAVDYVWKDVQGHYRELLHEAIKTALEQEKLRQQAEEAHRQVQEARDRAEALLREVNHRVANSLALVSSFMHLQAHALSDPAAKQMLHDALARISAVAGVHRRLYTSSDVRSVEVNAYLEGLVEELGASASDRCVVQFSPVTSQVHVPTDRAVSLGVIVAELLTNAVKYAYPSGAGEVRVILTCPDDDSLQVCVEDDGVGWSGEGAPQGSGLGTRIIRAMAQSLQAEVRYLAPGRGTCVVVKLPVQPPAK
jgi:two-component sensor histidine kinase